MEQTILFAPLLGALIAGVFWRLIGEGAAIWTSAGLSALSCILSWVLFFAVPDTGQTIFVMEWIQTGSLDASLSMRLDRLSLLMMVIVTSLSAMAQLYAIRSLHHPDDEIRPRALAYMSLLSFAAIVLVSADDLAQLVLGWQGVALAGYLLTSLQFRKLAATTASVRGFVMQRIGDLALVLGVAALFWISDSLRFDDALSEDSLQSSSSFDLLGAQFSASEVVGLLFVIAVAAKGAQFLFHLWSSDVAAAPAVGLAVLLGLASLIPSIFLLVRLEPWINAAGFAPVLLTVLGAVTVIAGATMAMAQEDVKPALGYIASSTMGLVLMLFGQGGFAASVELALGATVGLAALGLGLGCAISALAGQSGLRKMAGLRPDLFLCCLLLLLSGLAFTTLIALGVGQIASGWHGAALAGAGLTSFAIWRLVAVVCFGTAPKEREIAENAGTLGLVLPTALLTVASLVIAYAVHTLSQRRSEDPAFMAETLGLPVSALPDPALPWLSLVAVSAGALAALALFGLVPGAAKQMGGLLAGPQKMLRQGLHVGALYELIFVRPSKALAGLFSEQGDTKVFDGVLNGIAVSFVPALSRLAGRAQTGSVITYAVAMVVGLVVLALWMALIAGAG